MQLQKIYFSHFCLALTGLSLVVFLAAILIPQAPYLHDFGEWLFQSKILSLKLSNPELVDSYSLAPYPVPNSLSSALLAVLHFLFPPLLAGKLYLIGNLLAWCLVAGIFCRRFYRNSNQRRLCWCLVVCMACFSSFFWLGFVSYQLSLILFLWFISRYREDLPFSQLILFSVLLFFSHAITYLQMGAFVVLSVFLAGFPRRQIVALVPSGVLAVAFLIGRLTDSLRVISDAEWKNLAEAAVYKIGFVTMLGPFKNFVLPNGQTLLENTPSVYWTGVGSNLFTSLILGIIALIALVRFAKPGIRPGAEGQLARSCFWFALILIALYILAPYHFFGLIHPGGRLILPCVFCLLVMLPRVDLNLPTWLIVLIAVVSLSTTGAYYLATTQGDRLADGPRQQQMHPPPEAAKSVMAFNRWLYRNTRYEYYNYRIFAFQHRLQQLRQQNYRGLGFSTGPLVDYSQNHSAK